MKKLKKYAGYTLILIIVTSILRLIIADNTGLGIGEAYYFKGAKLLQLSYFDQPPLFLWISGLSIRIFGNTNLALRLPAILFFTGTQWFLFKITKHLFNEKAGFFAVLLVNISFVFTIPVATWFQPDAPLMFFWLLCTWFLIQILFPKEELTKPKIIVLWILVGISLGLTTLSKYHSIFLMAGAFIFVLLKKGYHYYLKHPGPYLAIIINLIIALPVLIWNYQNDWVSFIFQGSRAGTSEFQLHINWFLRSLYGQTLWLAPWIWIPLIFQLIRSYSKGNDQPVFAFIFWTAILPIVFFTIVTLWSDTGFHFHWQAPGYLMLFIVLGNYIADRWEEYIRTRIWVYTSTILTLIIAVLLIFQMNKGILNDYGVNWLVENTILKYDPTIEGTDYDEIYDRFEEEGWIEKDSLFLGATTWWQVGKPDWALKGEKEAVVFNCDPRNHAYYSDPVKLKGYDAIVITQSSDSIVNHLVKPFFTKVDQLKNIDIIRNQITELSLKVYYCKNFQIPHEPMEYLPVYRQLKRKSPF